MSIRVAVGFWEQYDEEVLQFAKQLGIDSMQVDTPKIPGERFWSVEDLIAYRTCCESYGMKLETIENVPITFMDKIMLGLPGRDEQIENYCTTIRNLGRAGIPLLGYHFMPNQVWRTTAEEPWRGGAKVWAFDQSQMHLGNQMVYEHIGTSIEKLLSEDEMWENYEYFLRAVMPVAEESGVRLALHPDDPPMSIVHGVTRLFYKPDNFKKAMELANSPAWGLNLCLGCCSEMVGGAINVHEMIDFFGPLGRIFYVHFRDVQGFVPSFKECFLGEGNYRPAEVLRKLVRYGFDGFLLDDHVPVLPGDTPWGHRSHAHQLGYIQGILEAIKEISGKHA